MVEAGKEGRGFLYMKGAGSRSQQFGIGTFNERGRARASVNSPP